MICCIVLRCVCCVVWCNGVLCGVRVCLCVALCCVVLRCVVLCVALPFDLC